MRFILLARLSLALLSTMVTTHAIAYERDVHYGLTLWLAMKAGFDQSQATAIAWGNLKVDSGGPQEPDALLDYACTRRDPRAAQRVMARHFPAEVELPAPPSRRIVAPGSPYVRSIIQRTVGASKGREQVSLSLFGSALHTLQDSWSHAGVPEAPAPSEAIQCDSQLASGHPSSRGGAQSHAADLTYAYPEEVMSMAKSTYEAMVAYPPVQGKQREADSWEDLAAAVEQFSKARTKTEKRMWFDSHGIKSTAFMQGISLPDGPAPGTLEFHNPLLPVLQQNASAQRDVPAEARVFFDTFMERWLSDTPAEQVVTEFGRTGNRRNAASIGKESAQLAARLKLWKMRDHGSVWRLAHQTQPFSARDITLINKLAVPSSLVHPSSVASAFEALVNKQAETSPILPFLVRDLPASSAGTHRIVAIGRLKHLPYDTVGWIAEQTGRGWKLVDMVAVIDQ